ncbi:MAG: cardiolipin synthase [Butyricicoccus sp.]|nr:cardiolipin synthase [Butyricicoccus sp.]
MEEERNGLYLIRKGRKGLVRAVFSRLGIISLLLVLQAAFLIFSILRFSQYTPYMVSVSAIFTVSMVLYLINSKIDPTGKITWLILIMLFPITGAVLLLYTRTDVGHRALKKRLLTLNTDTHESIPQSEETMARLREERPAAASLAHYISRAGCYPAYDCTQTTYLPSGEAKFKAMLRELERAKHFIFLEYFIINEGYMWSRILEVLARKAKSGVEVRVIYDGTCEFSTLPHDYPKRLELLGIKCKIFSPLTPFISTHYNYRDHRKILVIDGHTAFTGGVNLADEYINRTERFGHWKDAALMLKGEAVKSFTLMFLQMWSINDNAPEFGRYLSMPSRPPAETKGYVIPFGDCPLDGYKLGEHVYMDILNRARRYVHIMTPYLIMDGEMECAVKFAAERGVDVAIILPGVPDKDIPYALAWTHYAPLLASGVRIFEYTPGFVHSKVFVSDDEAAVVGTINLDYRSLYHHFECAAYMTGTSCIPDIERDFQQTLTKCRQIKPENLRDVKWTRKATGFVMKAVSPLL